MVLNVELSEWEAYQLNSAVFALGRAIEDRLDAIVRTKSGKGVKPGRVRQAVERELQRILYPDATPQFASLASKLPK